MQQGLKFFVLTYWIFMIIVNANLYSMDFKQTMITVNSVKRPERLKPLQRYDLDSYIDSFFDDEKECNICEFKQSHEFLFKPKQKKSMQPMCCLLAGLGALSVCCCIIGYKFFAIDSSF